MRPQRRKHGPRPDGRTADVLVAFGEIAARHRDVPVVISSWQGSREILFGDVRKLYAEAMLGQQNPAEVTSRITAKRDQEAVRALGLLPLRGDPARRRADIQRRYAVLREFERGSKAFGSMRQASERTAVRIGLENLARTAGYPDPLRFTWAVEAQEAGDLAAGPVAVVKGDVTLTLSVDAGGTTELAIARDGRALKSVPAALRKDPDVTALQARKTELAKQAALVRVTLEAAMVTQDAFTAGDFAELRRHPVVAPMLAQLVWVKEDGQTASLDEGQRDGPLRIAHPVDFMADGSASSTGTTSSPGSRSRTAS
jgi:hypothetical protein